MEAGDQATDLVFVDPVQVVDFEAAQFFEKQSEVALVGHPGAG